METLSYFLYVTLLWSKTRTIIIHTQNIVPVGAQVQLHCCKIDFFIAMHVTMGS